MDRQALEAWLGQGLSLDRIAELTGRHPSTVSYWVRKHGLRANGSERHGPKGALERGVLEGLYGEGLSIRQIAKRLAVSPGKVRYWSQRHGVELRKRAPLDLEPIPGAPRHAIGSCRVHGRTKFRLRSGNAYRCMRCDQERVAEQRRRVKLRLVVQAGGSCAICGYDRCPAALEFHHLEPDRKGFNLSHRMTLAWAALSTEASKCVLVCANCHAELEAGEAVLPARYRFQGDRAYADRSPDPG